ncbi:MAG: hypothetical protein EOO88_08440 [Pedobacter sp.]|nr:MAG: hypothetical protein EOO88_08440 [Pedobacter sp.]
MSETTDRWKAEIQHKINERTVGWTDEEKAKLDPVYLKQVIDLVASKERTAAEMQEFNDKLDQLITWIPIRSDDEQLAYGLYSKELSEFKSFAGSKYQVVPKRHYEQLFLPIGIALGVSFGLLFKNLALGLSLGIAIGVALGARMKRKAKKQGRVID